MRLALFFWMVLLLATSVTASDSCVADVKDAEKGVHVVVEACSNIGSYSVGGLYNGEFKKLTFQYPQPWKGTFTTFNVDGEYYCTSENPKNCTLMDEYVTWKPSVRGKDIETRWDLESVSILQSLSIVENKTTIRYSIKNTDTVDHSISVRFHIDTMLGINDGAPIYIPGDGLKTREVEYSGNKLNFEYWKAYNKPNEPTIVATGTIDPKAQMTYPSKVVIADWKVSKDTAWDYMPLDRSITGDSAILLYYSLGTVKAGEEKVVKTSYGSEAPVLTQEQGRVGLTEITLSSISGQYCPNDDVVFKVDVLNTETQKSESVTLLVEHDNIVYYNNTITTTFPKDQVKTLEYKWVIPQQQDSRAYTVKAILLNSTGVIDAKEKPQAVNVDPKLCVSPTIKVGGDILGGLLFVVIVVILGLLGAAAAYLWYNRGDVEFKKYVDDENVNVTVTNNTQRTLREVIIIDTIPTGVEVRVRTLNAVRKQNTIIWDIGELRPKDSATLEYLIRGGYAVNEGVVRWKGGNKKLR